MANYNGARRKTTVGNRNAKSQSAETDGKNRNYYTQNTGSGDGWGNTGRRPSRSTSDDGWGDVGRRPSNYTSDDLWGPLPSEQAVTENAWERKGSWKNQKHHTNQGKKPVPLVGPNFSWGNDEEYPALDSRPHVENVWEKRKEKLEGRKAMEPTNMTEEELMIKKAIELSKREAKEEEERRRLIEEEYELQNEMLAQNPEFFSDFLTPDVLDETNKSVKPGATDYQHNDFKNGYVEKESIWNYPKPVETQWPQKQSQKPGKKKKRNKSQSSTHMEDEITTPNAWSDGEKFDHDKPNETRLPEQNEYQDIQDNWSQNPVSKNYCNEAEEYESQFVDEDPDYSSAKPTSTTSPDAENETKLHKDVQPKISKVIDMFGGWGSKNTQNSSLKSSHQQERFESYDDFSSANSVSNNEEIYQDNWGKSEEIPNTQNASLKSSHKQERFESYDDFSSANSVSNNKEIYQDNWGKSEEMPKCDENLQFSKNSSKHREVENSSINENDQSLVYEEDSWSKYSSNDTQYSNNESKHSLYSHVESNIAASASSTFCNAATNASNTGASSFCKKSVPKDDVMNSIVQDYASLAVKCTDSSPMDTVPIPRKSKDIFSSVATLLNEDIPKPDTTGFQHPSVGQPHNLSMPAVNQSEIMYSLNNTAPTEVPNENISGSWNDSNIGFPANPERNEVNNSLFLQPVNEPERDVPNDRVDFPVGSAIPAPIKQETSFPCQPNPVMGNFMDPNLMMGINPLMMQQMMMLNNPFFLQQLRQMQMYYTAMSMPFHSPMISPVPLPPFNTILNNTVGNVFNGDPNSNMNPVPQQSVESNPSIPPPIYNFENEVERSMPSESDASQTSAVPNVEFENSWLTDLLSEGAAHMDSFIPPPTMPVTNPENPYPAPNAENMVDVNIAQDSLQSAYRNETIPQKTNCDMKNLKPESSAMRYGRTEDVNANTRIVNSNNTPQSSVPDVVEASGWGDIDDMPKKNCTSWNDDVDGWADEKVTSSKSMISSSRYASRKQATTRQPIRQPRQTSQW